MKNTKEKLLQTAAELFAKHGLDGVSTRDLAKKSGVNLCSINYYFGSKQKLYEAVIDEVSSFILNNFVSRVLAEISQNRECLSPRGEIESILCRFLDFMLGGKVLEVKIELLIKELLKPSPAYDRFYSEVFEPLHKHVSNLISEDLGLPQGDSCSILLAHTLFGQVIMFRIHQEALFRRLGVKNYTSELIAEIQTLLMKNCAAVLDKAKEDK